MELLDGNFNDCFLISPRKLGKISNMMDIFQMGWRNHQPENVWVRSTPQAGCPCQMKLRFF